MLPNIESRMFSQINIRKDPEPFCCCFMEKVKSIIPFLSANRDRGFSPCFCFSQKAMTSFFGGAPTAFPLKAAGNISHKKIHKILKYQTSIKGELSRWTFK